MHETTNSGTDVKSDTSSGAQPWFEWRGANLYPIHRNGRRLFGWAIGIVIFLSVVPVAAVLALPKFFPETLIRPVGNVSFIAGIAVVALALLIAQRKSVTSARK